MKHKRLLTVTAACIIAVGIIIGSIPVNKNVIIAEAKANDENTAEIIFDKKTTTENIGKYFATNEGYGEFDGVKGLLLPSSAGSDVALSLNVNDKFIKDNDDGTVVYVTVEYYDVGTGCFQLVYDSTYSPYDRSYQYSDMVHLGNTSTWKTHTFELTDAYFGNRLDGEYDIKVAARSKRITSSLGNIIIHSVKIEKQEDKRPVQVLEGKTEYLGNIFGNDEEKEFDLRIKNYSDKDEKRTVRVSVTDDTLTEYWSEEFNLSFKPKEEQIQSIAAKVDRYGTYYLKAEIINDKGETEFKKEIPFSYVNNRRDGKLNYDFGYCVHFNWKRSPSEGCEIIKKSNVGTFRCEFDWTACDLGWEELPVFAPQTAVSDMKKAASESGVKQMVILGLSAVGKYGFKVQGDFPSTPEQMQAWKTYVENVVKYMGDDAYGYEVWNEPNHSTFGTGGPDMYADMAKVACKTVKEVDPTKKVAVMSFTGLQSSKYFEWYTQALDSGAADYADAISVHPYCQGMPGETILGAVKRFKETAKERTGKDFEMWHTEQGWPIGEFNQTEEVQAEYFTRYYMHERANGVLENLMVYDLTDDGALSSERENRFGIMESHSSETTDYPYRAKKAYVAIANMNNILLDAKGIENKEIDENVNICRFERSEREETGKQVISLWSVYDPKPVALNLGVKDVTYSDMYGNQKKLHSDNGIFNFVASKSPVYIMGDFTGFEVTDNTIEFSEVDINAAAGDRKTITVTNNTGKKLTSKISGVNNSLSETKESVIDKVGTVQIDIPETLGVETKIDLEFYDGEQLICIAQLPLSIKEKLSSTVQCNLKSTENLNDWTADIEIENLSELKAVNGKLTITSPQKFRTVAEEKEIGVIPAGKKAEINLQLPEIKEKAMEPFEYEIELDNGYKQSFSQMINFTLSAYAKTKPKIDGIIEDGEWNKDTEMISNNINNAVMLGSNVYGGEKDLSFGAVLEWDEENMYLCINAKDDIHSVDATGSGIWQNDCPQIGISYKGEGDPSVGESLFTEIGFCDTKTQGPTVWCYSRQKSDKGTGDISSKCDLAVRREGTNTVYEVRIPWSEILPEGYKIEETDSIQFSMLLNDNDGNGRKGWMEYASGIGSKKDVSLFTKLSLIK